VKQIELLPQFFAFARVQTVGSHHRSGDQWLAAEWSRPLAELVCDDFGTGGYAERGSEVRILPEQSVLLKLGVGTNQPLRSAKCRKG
jgi:hypothetical protein